MTQRASKIHQHLGQCGDTLAVIAAGVPIGEVVQCKCGRRFLKERIVLWRILSLQRFLKARPHRGYVYWYPTRRPAGTVIHFLETS